MTKHNEMEWNQIHFKKYNILNWEPSVAQGTCRVLIVTHRYLIESISQCLHVKTMLASRYVSFYETIEASSKF